MRSKKYYALIAVACLLIGWATAQRDRSIPRNRSIGVDRNPALPRAIPMTPYEICKFVIMDLSADRGKILLDECTGDS
jgi:hypothetical protein